MINIAAHVRIFDADPDDDLVKKRKTAIKDLASRYTRNKSVNQLFQLANDLAQSVEVNGLPSEKFTSDVSSAVQKTAEAFIAEGNELQITVCGLLGALQLLDGVPAKSNSLTTTDVLAIGLWTSLSFQEARTEVGLESLRAEVLQSAQQHVLRTATISRQRNAVPDSVFEAPEQYDPVSIKAAIEAAVKPTIETLRANAAVDREEIDLLWWVLTDWSELLDCRLSTAENPAAAAIACGLEAGGMLRRMPASAHRHLVLRHVGKTEEFSLPGLLKAVGGERERLLGHYDADAVFSNYPAVFPLLTALRSGSAKDAKTKIKRSLDEWASRALLESSALHITGHLPNVAL